MTDSRDLLIRLMTLSGDDDHVAQQRMRPRSGSQRRDPVPPTATRDPETRRYFSGDRSGSSERGLSLETHTRRHPRGAPSTDAYRDRDRRRIRIRDLTRDVTLHTRQNFASASGARSRPPPMAARASERTACASPAEPLAVETRRSRRRSTRWRGTLRRCGYEISHVELTE